MDRKAKASGKKQETKSEKRHIPVGTIRIKVADFKAYEKTKTGWKRSKREFPEAMHVIELFKAHSNLSELLDGKNIHFMKGQLSPGGKCQGARISVLPDGRKIDKAYSLFADHLTIHDEASNQHWDVLCRNPGGTYSYAYTLEKKEQNTKRKYREVEEFEKLYPTIEARTTKALEDESDWMAVPMYTLLKTCMRVGNEIYYKAHGNKGLTTLKKRDVRIRGRRVTFTYLSKGGVPRIIIEDFPESYVKRLARMLKDIGPGDFVFVHPKTGHPLSDIHFKRAFERYCGKAFYPHIVRSFYATEKAKEFISMHDKASKKDILDLYRYIASRLGHKKYVKKDHEWKECYNVTIHHYIEPDILSKLASMTEKK